MQLALRAGFALITCLHARGVLCSTAAYTLGEKGCVQGVHIKHLELGRVPRGSSEPEPVFRRSHPFVLLTAGGLLPPLFRAFEPACSEDVEVPELRCMSRFCKALLFSLEREEPAIAEDG